MRAEREQVWEGKREEGAPVQLEAESWGQGPVLVRKRMPLLFSGHQLQLEHSP